MAAKLENSDEDSFIILGTSPGTSMDVKFGLENGDTLDKVQIEDAMKDLSNEACTALKAHFKLGDCQPSPASLMAASVIITDDKSTEELQKRFGEIIDENVILKETLKKNNDSMKEQFLLIASCQEDMMKTHLVHKEKFEETRDLVERLRHENKKLKHDIVKLAESEPADKSASGGRSGPASALEFVTSPDDDTVNKLTAQLDLVEKQRRQALVDNEKLTWQKESLEHIVDATSKERDELKEKLQNAELKLSHKDVEHTMEIDKLNFIVQNLQNKMSAASPEEAAKREALDSKISYLQGELKTAQLRVLELESVKLEYSKYKSGFAETVKLYKDQIQDLRNRLKEVSTTLFQPVRLSISPGGSSSDPDNRVKLYDRTLKHLADMLNQLANGTADRLFEALAASTTLLEVRLEQASADAARAALRDLRLRLERLHADTLANVAQVRGTLSIFEGIFKDYTELAKKQGPPQSMSMDTLTEALMARGRELQAAEAELAGLRARHDDAELLRAQLDLYRSDFEAERESREKLASEKEDLLRDLRKAQRSNTEFQQQLDEVRKMNPTLHRNAFAAALQRTALAGANTVKQPSASQPASLANSTTGNMVYTCPKCLRFASDQYKVMEDHFDFCLDDF